MIVELGNRAARLGIDDAPKVTTIHIPDPDENGLGGYSHVHDAISVGDFQKHIYEADTRRDGITRLPDHEALLAIHRAWPTQSVDKPSWCEVIATEATPPGVAESIQAFLVEHFAVEGEKPGNVEDTHWTRFGPPGVGGPSIPDLKALYLNSGRAISNINDGGGQVGATGQATAATATTLTTASTYTTNQWTGYRVYASVSATQMVWGNVLSNTNAAGASVLTVDRWYTVGTPGGAAGSTPAATATFVLADGGFVSGWFVGLATGANAPAATDVSLSTNGNTEYAVAGGGYVRKIAPYAQTSGVASRSLTLTPVFTGNGSDTYPQTFTTIGVFVGMVVGAAGTMKFETTLNASATVAASGDQVTVTETITGS